MLNFIIYDDEKTFSQKNKKIIDKKMMKTDYDYKCYIFDSYDEQFENLIKENIGLKVYLLDIEGKSKSGLDIVRIIREKYEDWCSLIIVITNHNEFKYDALSSRLYLMDFINKLDNWEDILGEDIDRIIKSYGNCTECLVYEFNHSFKRIEYKNITYIEKEKDSKKCLIHTIYGDHEIGGTITDVLGQLDDNFIRTSRSTIVNIKQILEYDKKSNEIVLLDGKKVTDISRLCKKEVSDSVNGLFM